MTESSGPEAAGFSSAKRELLLLLKQRPDLSLSQIAALRRISKVAALHHLSSLEEQGLVERSYERKSVGRPAVHFRLSERSAGIFPQSYAQMSLVAIDYIERHLGRAAVVGMLQERSHELADQNRPRLAAPVLRDRVDTLALSIDSNMRRSTSQASGYRPAIATIGQLCSRSSTTAPRVPPTSAM